MHGTRGADPGKLQRHLRVLTDHPEWARTCRDCARYVFESDGAIAEHPVAVTPAGDAICAKTERPAGETPPCEICPKWPDAVPPADRRALEGDEDLFAAAWFHDLRHLYAEGRVGGWAAGCDPFTRAALALFDRHERDLDRRHLADAVVSAARELLKR